MQPELIRVINSTSESFMKGFLHDGWARIPQGSGEGGGALKGSYLQIVDTAL